MALVIYFHDDSVLAIFQLLGHIEIERCKPTDVVSHLGAVHIDVAVIIDSAEVEQSVASLCRMPIETLLEPYRTLVEEQAFVSGVPV